MPIADMQDFAGLRGTGDASIVERLAMPRGHRSSREERIGSLRRKCQGASRKD
jgi:hypothetical protein